MFHSLLVEILQKLVQMSPPKEGHYGTVFEEREKYKEKKSKKKSTDLRANENQPMDG